MNALENYIEACRLGSDAFNFTMLNYQTLISFSDAIPDQNNDCVDVIALAALPFAGSFCSDSFDQAPSRSSPTAPLLPSQHHPPATADVRGSTKRVRTSPPPHSVACSLILFASIRRTCCSRSAASAKFLVTFVLPQLTQPRGRQQPKRRLAFLHFVRTFCVLHTSVQHTPSKLTQRTHSEAERGVRSLMRTEA